MNGFLQSLPLFIVIENDLFGKYGHFSGIDGFIAIK